MEYIKKRFPGIMVCLGIAIPSYFLGKMYPVIGGPVIAIILGMIITLIWKNKGAAQDGIKYTSKFVLQHAVILLGFGMNLNVILETGKQSLPIIVSTVATSLLIAFVLHKAMDIDDNTATLIGVGSSICGGSAIAATAPVIEADNDEVAQAISVIFFFNVIAALFFPSFAKLLGFSTQSGEAFGIFAGTAINDTSSVTAASATWDSMWGLGTATLDKAVTVKLTRTLAIIPITLVLAFIRAKKAEQGSIESSGKKPTLKQVFPFFIIYFVIASIITTIAVNKGYDPAIFKPLKNLSKFFIIMAMGAIGLNSNIVKLIKNGGKPIFLGLSCWIGITAVSLIMQHIMHIW